MATVELRLGDMFDGPSDLIVLPCSTAGNITDFVRQKLAHHHIPYPRPGMLLGDVQVFPFEGGENIAQFVAYAASVENMQSRPEAIRRIGTQLGEYTREEASVRHVAAPLLGAGAGGLRSEVAVSSIREGFRSSCHKDSLLVISVLHENVLERVRRNLSSILSPPPFEGTGPASREQTTDSVASVEGRALHAASEAERPPRVFVCYSHTSSEHEEWVVGLGLFLRQNGIEARLDVWHLRRGMDLAQFMTNELSLADRVVLVSDAKYAEKADGRVGGVGWETMIIQGDIARLPPEATKYLVIVKNPTVDEGLPRYLRTKFVIHWPDASADHKNRDLLLRELFDAVNVPVIGPRPVLL